MTNVLFGSVDVTTGSAVDTTGTMAITCSGFVGVGGGRLCISIDVGSAGDATSRQMTGPGAATLRYDLYTNSARTQRWGSWETGYAAAGLQVDVPNGTTNVTVYARLLGLQQSAVAGAYSATFAGNPFIRYRNTAAASNCPTSAYQTTSSSFSVTATVLTTCSVSAANLNFGSQTLLTSNVDATSSVTVRCTNQTPYQVGLNAGNGVGATVANRKMTSGGNTITYALYTNSGRTSVWGNTVGTDTLGGTGSGSDQILTVYGRVPPQTTPQPSTYSDTIVVTVTY